MAKKKKEKQSAQAKMAAEVVKLDQAITAKNHAGQPTKYTDELAKEICVRLSHGELLKNICLDDHMPNRRTVYNWLYDNEQFFLLYARARAEQSDFWVEQCVELADQANDADYSAAQRLKVDTRKWLAGKIRPRMWGDDARGFEGTEKSSGTNSVKRLVDRFRATKRKRPGNSEDPGSDEGGT